MAETFLDSVRETVRRGYCQGLSLADDFYDWVEAGTRLVPNGGILTEIPRAGISAANGLFCDRAPTAPPPPAPPQFTGGQCVGDRYRVIATYDRFSNGQFAATQVDQVGSQLYTGPIEAVFLTAGNQDVNVRHNSGQISDHVSGNPSSITYRDIRDVRVENVDNPADNCGDLPGGNPNPEPPGTITPVPDDIVYGPPGNEITIPILIGWAESLISVTGELTIPFTIGDVNFALNGEINLTTGDINFNIGGEKGGNEQCCLPPGADDDDVDEDGDEDDDETETQIIGAIVNGAVDDSVLRSTKIAQPNGPDFYNPSIGNLYFKLKLGGLIFWTEPIPIKHQNQYISCPAAFGAIRVAANPRQGVTLRLTPVRRKIAFSEFN